MRSPHPQLRSIAFALAGGLACLLAWPPRGRTHDPITTKVTFNKEIVRILQRHCLGCHSAEKIKADIPLTTYEEARPWAKAIKEEVLEKRMPPFQAVKGYGRFEHGYALPQRDVELLVSWIEGGAPKGKEADYPKDLLADHWPLGRPELILQPEQETKLAADAATATRCFGLPTGLSEERRLSAIDFHPGNGAVVWRAEIGLERPASARVIKAGNGDNAACGDDAESISHWLPGQTSVRFPAGVARLLPAGARLVLKLHYQANGAVQTDRSAVGLYFAKEPARPLRSLPLTPPVATIPAGAAAQRIKASHTLTAAAEIIAVRPLLFPFATSVEAVAWRPDGTAEVLIWAKHYRYDWQPTYYFKQPAAWPRGTRIEVTAYLDNSADNPHNPADPPAAVRFAEPLCELLTAAPSRGKQ